MSQANLAQPRPRRARNGKPSRDDLLAPSARDSRSASEGSSRTSTPIPQDAPPSVKATFSARKHKRAAIKNRLFPTIDYAARVSHFDPRSDHHDFRGFFVLFWIGLAVMVITAMLRKFKETGSLLGLSQWTLFTENIWELALSDLLMVLSSCLCLPLHLLYRKSRMFRWHYGGMIVQSVFQLTWLVYWIGWVRPLSPNLCLFFQLAVHSHLDVDSPGLLHAAHPRAVHEDALLRVCLLSHNP
jgi:sterol O-acyltransferase